MKINLALLGKDVYTGLEDESFKLSHLIKDSGIYCVQKREIDLDTQTIKTHKQEFKVPKLISILNKKKKFKTEEESLFLFTDAVVEDDYMKDSEVFYLSWVLHGDFKMQCGSDSLVLKPGNIFLFNPDHAYKVTSLQDKQPSIVHTRIIHQNLYKDFLKTLIET